MKRRPHSKNAVDNSPYKPQLPPLSTLLGSFRQTLDSIIENLDVLSDIVEFIGPYQFRFVAGINKSFHTAYLLAFASNKSTYLNASTLSHAKICYKEIRLCGNFDRIMNQQKK